MRTFGLLLCLAVALIGSADAKRRTARVRILNETGQKVLSVGVVHKYSDNYRGSHTWENVRSASATSADMTVQYNTGIFTTGRDWWQVTYVLADGKTRITSPNNFRDILDFLEGLLNIAMDAQEAVSDVVSSMGPNAAAAAKANAAVRAVVSKMTNDASTSGMKQHILRGEDAGEVTTIRLKRNGKVRFESPSGNSETGTKRS